MKGLLAGIGMLMLSIGPMVYGQDADKIPLKYQFGIMI
jgi:hypothetical protein